MASARKTSDTTSLLAQTVTAPVPQAFSPAQWANLAELLAAQDVVVLPLNPRALMQAGESEARWAAGRPLGPLDGVPVTVKDLLNVAGFPTRRGSKITDATPAPEDAPAVMGLKAAGAVILGKTTTTEFGWKTPGDCPLHGITRNPWDPRRTPGGSSSGAGAAGAACFGPLHVGTDAGGSIRIPAAYCGLVGVKPSHGRVPQWPHSAFGSVSCAGPMTRSVRDAALMLSAMARADVRDPFCLPDEPRDWRQGIEGGVRGMRVASQCAMPQSSSSRGLAYSSCASGCWPRARSALSSKGVAWSAVNGGER